MRERGKKLNLKQDDIKVEDSLHFDFFYNGDEEIQFKCISSQFFDSKQPEIELILYLKLYSEVFLFLNMFFIF